MSKTEKVAVAPEKTTDETVTPTPEPTPKPSNADVRALAEESLAEDNLVGTTEEDGDTSEPLTDSSTEDNSEEKESLEEGEEPAEDSEEADGTELDEFLEESTESVAEQDVEKKSGLEKRIDKLTASNYEKDAEIAKLKSTTEKVDTKPETKPKYTNDQLVKALTEAREEGNTALEVEIMQYISDAKADNVKAEFEAKNKAVEDARKKQETEWIAITDMFHYDEVEIYPGSQTDLNIKNNSSLIYRLASELFINKGYNQKDNGMSLAVSQALKLILAKKKTSVKPQKSSKEKQLETKVKKLKRKTSSPSGSKTVKEEPKAKSSRPKSDVDKVNDAISERRNLAAWKNV